MTAPGTAMTGATRIGSDPSPVLVQGAILELLKEWMKSIGLEIILGIKSCGGATKLLDTFGGTIVEELVAVKAWS
jgi:hypothetical protein